VSGSLKKCVRTYEMLYQCSVNIKMTSSALSRSRGTGKSGALTRQHNSDPDIDPDQDPSSEC